jgi:hypothetical protein
MQTVIVASALSLGALGIAACATDPAAGDPPAGRSGLQIRHSGTPVSGSLFQCTGTWPSSLTPCSVPWSSQPQTLATSDRPGLVELALRRIPIPVDGGASTVFIDLRFGNDDRIVSATAHETTTQAGTLRVVETSEATGGWIDPYVAGRTADVRNAGQFSLTFAWGSISGTYDTASP